MEQGSASCSCIGSVADAAEHRCDETRQLTVVVLSLPCSCPALTAYKRHPATQQMSDQELIGELFSKSAQAKPHTEK